MLHMAANNQENAVSLVLELQINLKVVGANMESLLIIGTDYMHWANIWLGRAGLKAIPVVNH